MYEIELIVEGEGGPRLRVGGRVLFVGRGRQCDLVLQDEAISTRHLAIWSGDGQLFVEDLRSRNGTRINGRPLQGRGELRTDDVIELGVSVRLRVLDVPSERASLPQEHPLVEDMASGACFPLRKERFVFGGESSADVYIPGAARSAAVLIVHADGEIWLGADAEDRLLQKDEEFQVSGRRFRLSTPAHDLGLTRELVTVGYPYGLFASLDGPAGPVATITHLENNVAVELRAETRAVLLYLLGRKLREDIASGVPALDRGWLSESEAAQGIWGRGGVANRGTALNVLIFRIRKDLEAGGFDPWCLEKRARCLRIRVEQAEIGGSQDQNPDPRSR